MKRKGFQITANLFNNPYLILLMDALRFLSPAKTKNESAIRARDRADILNGRLGEPVSKPSANVNGVLARDRILIGTSLFGPVPKVTEQDIQRIKDGGFDFIISENTGEYSKSIHDWCEKYGIAVIDQELREGLAKEDYEALKRGEDVPPLSFSPHPASVGDVLCDEPNCSDFERLKRLQNNHRKNFPDRFAFYNLFPAGAVKSQLGVKPYREYVDRFSKAVNCDYISADIYPFHPSKLLNIFEMMMCLETYHGVGNACRRDGKDFWLYIQSQCNWFSRVYTMTTYEMIKWQVYASICYGCRSIIHASYNPVWGDEAMGLIDYRGKLTEQYLYAKRVNAEIANLSPILKDYRSLGVDFARSQKNNSHFSVARVKQKAQNHSQGFHGIPLIKRIESQSTALAGYFHSCAGGNHGLMLVNCQDIYDPYASQNIKVYLNKVVRVCVYEHGCLSTQAETNVLSLSLDSCDSVFITFSE